MSETKTRNFAFLLYPESLPDNWKAELEAIGVPMAISPLHDKDKPERKSDDAMRKDAERRAKKQLESMPDSLDKAVALKQAKEYWLSVVHHEQDNLPEYKKPHYHVLYVNHNPVTARSVLNKLRRRLGDNAVSHIEIVDNVANYYLYLTHESPDAKAKKKHVYDKKDIVTLNNFDIDRYIVLDKEQKKVMGDAVMELVIEHGIRNMIELVRLIKEHGESIGISGISELEDVLNGRGWFLKMLFDGNFQEWQKAVKSQAERDARPPKSDTSETP